MKRGAIDHPKMLELAESLRLPIYAAVGLMESLSHWTAKYAPRGDVGRWSNDVIAKGVGWDREPAELVNALVRAHWLDISDEHRLIVHDWSQHADDSVHRVVARRVELFADGTPPNTKRLDPHEKPQVEKQLAKLVRGRTSGARRAHERRTPGALPEPVPEPSPEPEPVPLPEPRQSPALSEGAGTLPAVAGPRAKSPGSIAWETGYAPAYEARYGAPPVRNAQTNALMDRLVKLIGAEVAPGVCAYFVESPDAYFVKLGHDPKLLVANAGKLHTEYLTRRRITGTEARRNEETSANPFLRLAAKERAK